MKFFLKELFALLEFHSPFRKQNFTKHVKYYFYVITNYNVLKIYVYTSDENN